MAWGAAHQTPGRVLIEPLWNWNCKRHLSYPWLERLNRTFMELKWHGEQLIRHRTRGLNRTFMELKFRDECGFLRLVPVLIEPLWNWNQYKIFYSGEYGTVLIEPLWNWNEVCSDPFLVVILRLNRTFMELKFANLNNASANAMS